MFPDGADKLELSCGEFTVPATLLDIAVPGLGLIPDVLMVDPPTMLNNVIFLPFKKKA